MFVLNASLLFLSLLYSYFRLDWATTPQQKPLRMCCSRSAKKNTSDSCGEDIVGEEETLKEPNCLLDFFDKDHLIQSCKTIIKKRPNHGRIYLLAIVLSMALYTFQRGYD